MTKSTKEEAHYQNHPNGDEHCSVCTMSRGGTCTAVQGPIQPNGWCSFFKRSQVKEMAANSIGASSSVHGTGSVDLFDPMLNQKQRVLKRFKDIVNGKPKSRKQK